jgi:PelA/Pel-15E family pectate lyase
MGLITIPLKAFSSQPLDIIFHPDQSTQSDLWEVLMDHDRSWFSSPEAKRIAENILLYQRRSGGWPKNIDFFKPVSKTKKTELKEYPNEPLSTIDNGATYTQLFFLAQFIQSTGDNRAVLSFLRGLDYLLQAQYENGGWPQYYPLRKGYYSHITFNDDAMVGVLFLLKDVVHNTVLYGFVDSSRREKAKRAVKRGTDCILKTQIEVDGRLTAWCAQYDPGTLEPRPARSYERVSLSGKESVGIIRFLMSIDRPGDEIISAIQCGVEWLDRVRLCHLRIIREPDLASPTGFDKIVVSDPDASCLWARFYQIGSNQPIFSDRDGKIYQHLSEISFERRNEYGWLGKWPQTLLQHEYPKWRQKWSVQDNVLNKEAH